MQRSNDLLHQLSNTTYEVNAQSRTETWYRVIPNYVMLPLNPPGLDRSKGRRL